MSKVGRSKFHWDKAKKILQGEDPISPKFYYDGRHPEEHKIGERWKDKHGREWEQKDGYICKVTQFDDIRQSLQTPHQCPNCHRDMSKPKRQQDKMWRLYKKCFNCVIEEDTKRVINGTFKSYENAKIWQNQLSFLIDTKQAMEQMLATDIKRKLTFINENGTYDNMINDNYSQMKEFFENEVVEIDKEIKILQDNLNGLKIGEKNDNATIN